MGTNCCANTRKEGEEGQQATTIQSLKESATHYASVAKTKGQAAIVSGKAAIETAKYKQFWEK